MGEWNKTNKSTDIYTSAITKPAFSPFILWPSAIGGWRRERSIVSVISTEA